MNKTKIALLILMNTVLGFFISWNAMGINIYKLRLPDSNIMSSKFAFGMMVFHGIWFSVFFINIAAFFIYLINSIVKKNYSIIEHTCFVIFILSEAIGIYINNYAAESLRMLSLLMGFAVPFALSPIVLILSIRKLIKKEVLTGLLFAGQVFLYITWVVFIIQIITLFG